MSDRRGRVIGLLMTMQNEFLGTPGLTLTTSQAEKRFGADAPECEAILGALVDARVLARTTGGYTRFFPRQMVRPTGTDTSAPGRAQVGIAAA
jgi:hypothetical protein